MKKFISFLIVIAMVCAFAVMLAGCGTTREQRMEIYKGALQKGAKIAVTAYNIGGKEFAYAQIDKQVQEKKITADQGEMLKKAVDKGVEEISKLADGEPEVDGSTTD